MKKRIYKQCLAVFILCMIFCVSLISNVCASYNHIGIAITGVNYADGKLTADIRVSNSGEYTSGDIIVALKNKTSNELIAVNIIDNISVSDGEILTDTIELSIASMPEEYSLEAYMWENMDNLRPIAPAASYSPGSEAAPLGVYEIKDITSVEVYEKTDDAFWAKNEVNLNEFEPSNYLAKINMKEMTDVYALIKSHDVKNDKLYLTLDMPNYVQYRDGVKYSNVIVQYGEVNSENIAHVMTLERLIADITENPAGTYELTQDLDANTITYSSASLLPAEFSGTLNGNGYRILNLTTPLFNTLNGANINDLIIENANIPANGKGILANNSVSASITNTHIINSSITTGSSPVGAMFGGANSTVIEKSSVSNVEVRGGKRTGGLVGNASDTAIQNSYVSGTVSGTEDAIGGIMGQSSGTSAIENCYANVTMNGGWGNSKAGIIGYTSGNFTLKNNISLANGDSGKRVYGSLNGTKTILNNYELSSSAMKKQGVAYDQSGLSPVQELSDSEIESMLFQYVLKWDDKLWTTSRISRENLPVLMNSDPNYTQNQTEEAPPPKNPNIYIPNYSAMENTVGYDETKEVLYANLYRFMPFYETQHLIEAGKNFDASHILNQKIIKMIVPYDSAEKMLTALTTDNFDSISYIKVVFDDGSFERYHLKNAAADGRIATYRIEELDIFYQYDKYFINADNPLIQELITLIEGYTYENDLDPLTSEEDNRLYRDHYNEVIKVNPGEFVLQLLANTDVYQISNADIVNDKIRYDLTQTDILKRLLYAYNYADRWYNIEVGGINLRDVIFFGNLYGKNMNSVSFANQLLVSDAKRATANTQDFYIKSLASQTGQKNIGSFIDSFVSLSESYSDADEWFKDTWKNALVETTAAGHPELEYRAWAHIKRRENLILPILTLPENSTYIVSSPTQYIIGSQKVYINDPENPQQRQSLLNKMKSFAETISKFYGTAAGFIAQERFDGFTNLQIDRRTTTDGLQSNGTTKDPFHKNFHEAVGLWPATNATSAYAAGTTIYWVDNAALNSYATWTHETAHLQDGRIFLEGNGRRKGGGGEDYSNGNIAQNFGDGEFNMNLTYDYDPSTNVTANLTRERINTRPKIEDYYRKTFETLDFLDYVEALAFLKLSPEEQMRVGSKVTYPRVEDQEAGHSVIQILRLTAEDVEGLQTIEDLWNKHIIIKQNTTNDIFGAGLYTYDTIYTRHWYQSHNDTGRPDGMAIKQLAWEMLGFAGYDAYVTYYSNLSENDLEALRKITNDPDITWKDYKMARYQEMQEKWDEMTLFSADELLKEYERALHADAVYNKDYLILGYPITNSTNLRRKNYHYIKRATDDFRGEIFGSQENSVLIDTAEDFYDNITAHPTGTFILQNDIDVSGLTYDANSLFNLTFTGRLLGNGHKITGLQKPLFKEVKYASIENLIIDSADIITKQTKVGAVASTAASSNLKQVHLINSKITGAAQVGGLIGNASICRIEESSSNSDITASGDYAGGLIGQASQSTIINNYSKGKVTGGANYAGGLIAFANNRSLVQNNYSAAQVEAQAPEAYGGGFIGGATGRSDIINNICYGDVINSYKFDGRSALDYINEFYQNNYESSTSQGLSNADTENLQPGKISTATEEQMGDINFYADVLQWNNAVWDFSGTGFPHLKGFDPNM